MSEKPSWMPSNEEIRAARDAGKFYSDNPDSVSPLRVLLVSAVEKALAEQEAKVRRATLQEAARAVCGDCAVGVQLLPQTAEWEYGHPDGDGYRYDCAAAPIHGLIAELDKEADRE